MIGSRPRGTLCDSKGLAALLLVAGVCASIKVALANCLLALACIAWIVALLRRRAAWRSSPILLPLAAYLGVSVLSAGLSADPGFSFAELGDLATLAIVPMTLSLLDARRWDLLLKGLTAVAVVSSAVGLWQYLHGASSLAWRLRGLLNHYMTFSGWTLLVVLLLVGDIACHHDRRRLWWTVPACTLCTVTLLLSFTRNAWLGLASVLLVVLWRPRAVYLFLVLAVVTMLVAPHMPQMVGDRLLSIVDLGQESNYDRLCMVRAGVEMVADAPLLGVGPGMVQRSYPQYRVADAPRSRVPHLHSNPVQIAAERGLAGLAAYLALLGIFLGHTVLLLRDRRYSAFPAVAGCLLAVVGVSVAGLFEYNWGDNEVWIPTLVLLAVPWALAASGEGAGQREPGAGRRATGDGSREPGDGSREPGDGSREPGDGSRGSGDGGRGSGVGRRVSGVGMSGATQRSWGPGPDRCELLRAQRGTRS